MKIIHPFNTGKSKRNWPRRTRWAYAKKLFEYRRGLELLRGKRDEIAVRQAAIDIRHGELTIQSDDMMLRTVGMLTIGWALMERHVDEIVSLVFETDAERKIQSTLPVTLDNKLDYLRSARSKMVWLEPFVDRMRGLQSRIKIARVDRKNVTHGIVALSPRSIEIWQARVLNFQGPSSTESTVDYEPEQLTKACRDINTIAKDLGAMWADLQNAADAAEKPYLYN